MASDRQKFFALARKRFEQAETAETAQRGRELEDLKFYAGEQWPDDIVKARQGQTLNNNLPPVPARPTLTINLTREPVRQVLNQERQADLGVQLIPADDFGGLQEPIGKDEIELREGLVRRIQRDSEATDARTWAFARAAIAGRGFYGVMTRYVPGKSADQEVFIQRFYNQASVLLDPAHEQPDGSDAEWAFVGVDLPWDQYKAEYPRRAKGHKNAVCDMSDQDFRALGDEAPGWFTLDGETRVCRVVDYYYTTRTSRDLAMFEDGRAEWVDELPEGTDPGSYTTRTVITKAIKWAKLDGADDDVLDETDWPGHYLPIIKVLGEELQPYDSQRRCEGMVRPAMDSCRSFNYMVSKWVEQIGLAPIPPWLMAAGQDEGFEAEWAVSNTRTLPALHYNQKDLNGQLAPAPSRTSITTDISAIAASVQMFKESITDTMGVPPPALGHVDPTLKSGRAIQAVLQQAERGTSNYLDNLVRSMRHEGRIVNDLLFPIYGRPGRIARMMNPQGEMSTVILGKPFQVQDRTPVPVEVPEGGQPPADAKVYNLTADAEWNVAIKVSKNFDTRRQQEAEITGQIIAADPAQMAIIGDLFFKNQDGPGSQDMAKRYQAVLDPRVQATLQGQPQIPPEVQAKIAQMEQQLMELKPLADKNMADLQAKQLQEQAENQRALLKAQTDQQLELAKLQMDERIQNRKLEVQLEIEMAKLGSAQSMARAELEQQELHRHSEQSLQREQMQTQQAQADLDRQAAQEQAAMKAQTHGTDGNSGQ